MIQAPALSLPTFYLRAGLVFAGLRALSVVMHFLQPSPWGGPVVLSPSRFMPEALTIEVGLVLAIMSVGVFGEVVVRRLVQGARGVSAWRTLTLVFVVAHLIFAQIDMEVVRWLGQHITASYIANFAGARDGQLFTRILSGDWFFTGLGAVHGFAGAIAGFVLWLKYRAEAGRRSGMVVVLLGVFTVLTLSSPYWLRPSEKRWRRIQPAALGISSDFLKQWMGVGLPEHPEQALQDLVDIAYTGHLDGKVTPVDATYPLYRDNNVGALGPAEFKAQPLEVKPDVVVIVFETMRGFNTGFLSGPKDPLAAMPKLHAEFEQNALYFPRMHSAGYPSVEGAMGMHLGMWPHHSEIVFSSFLHANTVAFPEMLRAAGYQAEALLGADPSFSNFTPWFRRWYEQIEFDPANHHDGPLVDRFIEIYDAKHQSDKPMLMTLWTATTHPPYDVPPESGVTPADNIEDRFLQAMRYADGHIHRLLTHLKTSPRWHRTLVFILGDHSQPTGWQWRNSETIGELNPGHTWTSMAVLGGADVAPKPGRDERVISHIDLAPTVLGAVNLRHPNHFFGRDVLTSKESRPVVAFRWGTMFVEDERTRSIFRVEGSSSTTYGFDREEVRSYGALEGGELNPMATPDTIERYRDASRAWGQLLQGNLVAPPRAPEK